MVSNNYNQDIYHLRACCCRVEAGKADSICGQLVNVGCPDLAAKTSAIRETQIIGNNDQEIWTLGSCSHDAQPSLYVLFCDRAIRFCQASKSDMCVSGSWGRLVTE